MNATRTRFSKCAIGVTAVVGLGLVAIGPLAAAQGANFQRPMSPAARDQARRMRFTHEGNIANETGPQTATPATEAPTGYDSLTNGYDIQGPDFETLVEANVVGSRSFNENRFIYEEVDTVAKGLGPTYNAQSCRECHQNVVTGGASQITEQRTGHLSGGEFFDSQGGSLIQSRATNPEIVELVSTGDDIRTFRMSTNTLGDGYVEAVSNSTLLAIREAQPQSVRGSAIIVPVLEANGAARIGRFGWKCQHASLESFSGDAYLNEMGITNPLFPTENTSSGRDVSAYDPVPDPEDDGGDVKAFANYMRATKAPSRGAITSAVMAGEQVFTSTGCAACHVATLKTASTGTVVNGGALTVPAALGNKIFHPYSDFLMHNIGSGDGIPIQPTAEYASTANQIRTAPLWGLRTRSRLMHDGLSFAREDAIARHNGQASGSQRQYSALSPVDKQNLIAFLNSL